MSTDPITDVISLVRPRAVISAQLVAHGPFAVAFEPFPHVKFGTVVEGTCVIDVGRGASATCGPGDFYLLGNPPRYVIRSPTPTRRKPQPAKLLFTAARDNIVKVGTKTDGSRAHLIGGHFLLTPSHASLVVETLPPVLHIPADAAAPLREVFALITREVASPQPGGTLILEQLALVLLALGMRFHGATGERGWLHALADPAIGRALAIIHDDLRARLSLSDLASRVGMSRSAFALRFKQLVGSPPFDYASRWRMQIARDRLGTSTTTIKALAFELGYASETAFSTAFRREVGVAPRTFRDAASRATVTT